MGLIDDKILGGLPMFNAFTVSIISNVQHSRCKSEYSVSLGTKLTSLS